MPILDFLNKKKLEAEVTPSTSEAVVGSGSAMLFHISPLVTEKSSALQALHQYALQAPYATTKTHIRTLLKDVFHVHPNNIRMVPVAGRHVRYGRAQGKTRRWKKYIVQLPANEKLELLAHKVN